LIFLDNLFAANHVLVRYSISPQMGSEISRARWRASSSVSFGSPEKVEVKRQNAERRGEKAQIHLHLPSFCLLPFAFYLLPSPRSRVGLHLLRWIYTVLGEFFRARVKSFLATRYSLLATFYIIGFL
jgi:hypothetical protein